MRWPVTPWKTPPYWKRRYAWHPVKAQNMADVEVWVWLEPVGCHKEFWSSGACCGIATTYCTKEVMAQERAISY